jgi:RsiW-degrading membrane proteinase PrsW (M82 family)
LISLTFASLIKILLATLPIILFLFALIYLDSYKLVGLPSVLANVAMGVGAAVICFWVNSWIWAGMQWEATRYTRYGSPMVEEFFKSLFLVYLIGTRKAGFLVDAAIYGFAIGAGFALAENLYYFQSRPDALLSVWLIRGFGTATMHGCTTALFGIVSKLLTEVRSTVRTAAFLPGLAGAIVAHSFHNHFVIPPLISTAAIMVVFPGIVALVYWKSERSLQQWLGVGFDADMELLKLIHSGELSNSRIGHYLQSLRKSFRGEVVADMLCYLRIQVELALRAKGAFLMQKSGYPIQPDPEIGEKFGELCYLEHQIGKTGKQAVAPFVHTRSHDLWQLHKLVGS